MKQKDIKIFILLLLIVWTPMSALFAQQEAMHSQYIFNKQMFNPAYTGYRETTNFTALHRSQWVGFKGAPSTQYVTFDTPTKIDEIALGGTIMHDKIGPSSELSISADVAYRIRLRNRMTLAFGGKATLGVFQANLTDLELISDFYGQTDDFFLYNPRTVLLPNIGFGVFFYGKNFYAGLSSPKMIRNKLESTTGSMYELLLGTQRPTVYAIGGYIHKLNRYFKLQPGLQVRATDGAPISISGNLQLHYLKILTFGVFYNFKEVAGGTFQWQITDKIKIGYSIDVATSKLIRTNYGSHEIMFNYAFSKKRKRIVYPRYF